MQSIKQAAVQPKKQETEKKQAVSNTVIGVGLVGLAALASIGVYLATKGKGKVKPQELVEETKNQANTSKLEELKQQAQELKDRIRASYQERLSGFLPIQNFESLVIQDGFRQGGKTNITSSKDFDRAKDYITHLHENDGPSRDFYLPAKQLKNDIFSNLKSQLSVLQKDSDWVELRKIRKNLLKQKKTATKENRPIIEFHIELIDNILLSKVSKDSSKVTLFEELFGMNLKEASKMARKSSKEVFENVDYHSNNRPFETMAMDSRQLKLSDFFKQEVKQWGIANNTVKDTESVFKFLDNQKQKFQEYQKTLAQEFRQSDDVKALKELNRQITELEKQV